MRWWRRHQRGLIASALLGLPGCHPAGAPDPATLFQGIAADFLHGNLESARGHAAAAREAFKAQPDWGMRFRLLEADIMLRQSHAEEVLALLSAPDVMFPTQGELAIQRDWLRGLAYLRLDQAERSRAELQTARRLAETSHSPSIGAVLRAEGIAARDTGHAEAARRKFKDSLSAARRAYDPLLEASDLLDIGHDSRANRHFDLAIIEYQAAADFARSVGARRHLQLALGNMGWAYQNLGDFERALANFREAEQLAHEFGMKTNQVLWLQDAGLADYRLGRLAEARQDDEAALRIALTLPPAKETDEVANIQTNLALLSYEQGRYGAAAAYSDAAVRAAAGSKDNDVIAYSDFVHGLLDGRLPTGMADAERTLLAVRERTTDADIRTDAEDALANLYAARHDRAKAEGWYRRSLQTFEAKRSAVDSVELRLAAFSYGNTVYRDYAQFLLDAGRPAEALRLLDRSRARTLAEGLGLRTDPQGTWDAQALARRLQGTILFYSLGPRQSHLWAITARETRLYTLPAASLLEDWVAAYQHAIQKSSDPLQTTPAAASSLYDALIAPAAGLIGPDSRVFVIPDGALHALNFETLPEPAAAGRRFWIEHVTVTTAASLSMLAKPQPTTPAAAERRLLLIGDPLAAPDGFAALPHASAEVQQVQQHFAADSELILTGARAIPAAYADSGPEQFQYIHFVAHGTASRASPLDSAVVLSPPPGAPEEFKLYARDILQHRLSATLVTISACYGSGVRTFAGEGLVGLAWVFLRAGAHNVIGALWQADDASTAQLMDRLYTELRAGKTPDEALRAAKLALVRSGTVYRKPFYWGVFQLYAGA